MQDNFLPQRILQRIVADQVVRIRDHLLGEAVVALDAVQKVFAREHGEAHRLLGARLPFQVGFQLFFIHIPHNQQVDLFLFFDEITRKEHKIYLPHFADGVRDVLVLIRGFDDDAAEFVEEGELGVHHIVFVAVFDAAFKEAHLFKVIELAANGVDLLVETAGEFPNEKLFLRIEEEYREQFDSRLRCE